MKVRNLRVSLIHSNTSIIDIGVYLSKLLKVPHVWHFREFAKQHYHFSYNWGTSYANFIYSKGSSKILVVSEALGDYYKTIVPENKICKIYNGLDVSKYRKKENINSFTNIVTVGLLHPSKHQDVVIKAISLVVNRYGITDICLNIYGNACSDSYLNILKKIAIDEKIERNVVFHGYIDNIEMCLAQMDIGILASEYEAFGRVTVEYMLSGLIPVVSDSGANLEIVEEGVTGLIFKLNNEMELAQKIVEILNEKPRFCQIRENIQAYASERFSLSTSIKKVAEVYRSLT